MRANVFPKRTTVVLFPSLRVRLYITVIVRDENVRGQATDRHGTEPHLTRGATRLNEIGGSNRNQSEKDKHKEIAQTIVTKRKGTSCVSIPAEDTRYTDKQQRPTTIAQERQPDQKRSEENRRSGPLHDGGAMRPAATARVGPTRSWVSAPFTKS
jgi:hypothetical protein